MGAGRLEMLGQQLYRIVTSLYENEDFIKLLVNNNDDPLNTEVTKSKEDILEENLIIVSKIPKNDNIQSSYVIVSFDDIIISPNEEFKNLNVRVDIVCPPELWAINAKAPRIYMLMSEIDKVLNGKAISSMGRARFVIAEKLLLSGQLIGYSMEYTVVDFN